VAAVDSVVTNLKSQITKESLAGALVKMRSNLYDNLGGSFGLGRADLLCSFALFDDDPARINTLEDEFKKVTPELMHATIDSFLRPTNRTVLVVNPLLDNSKNNQK